MALGEDDERLDHVPLDLVGGGDGGRLGDGVVLEAGRLDLEGADPVAGGDDHVVGAARVPDVAVLVLGRGVLGVEPLAAEGLLAGLLVAPVAERVVRVGAGAQADLAALAPLDGVLVLVEELDVPAGHRPPHRALADLHEREVGAERVGLGQPVVVEDGDPVLLAEPADRLRVERLAGGADDAESLRVPLAGVGDRHHRPHRGRRREDVGDLVAGEEVELLGRVEAALALVDALDRAEPPRARAAARSRPPMPTPPCRGSARPRARRGSRRTPRGRGCSGGRGRCPSPCRWFPTCSRAGRGRRLRCPRRCGRPGRRRAVSSPRTSSSPTSDASKRSALAASVTRTAGSESPRRWRMPSSP